MASNAHDYNTSTESSSEGGDLPDSGDTPAHRNVPSSGSLSRHPATDSTAPRFLAVAAPGRKDLVVLVDTSAMRVPIIAPPSSPLDPATSPERRFVHRDEATPPDERICAQLWALWAALTFPLLLSSWLLLIPFIIWSKDTVVTEAPIFPLAKTPRVPITTLSPPPTVATTTNATPASTTFSWLGIPSRCLSQFPPPPEPLAYNVGPYPTGPVARNRMQRPIFCHFDNAEVMRAHSLQQPFDYMFETLPFALCPNVVYASVGIADGQLTSRLPRFEQNHGLPRLRQIVNARGFNDTRILLVLGGREEDAPHFWRLGRDPPTLDLLMRNVADGVRKYALDGITVHWAAPTSDCSGSDHDMVLSILLRRLNETFANYGMTQHIVSVILDIGVANEYLVDSVAKVVNYFFIGTYALTYTGQGPYQDMCRNLSRDAHEVIANYTSIARRVRVDQLCIMEDVAPWVALGVEHPGGDWTKTVGSDLFKAPIYLYDECNSADFCLKEPGQASCISHLAYVKPRIPVGKTAAIFLVPSVGTLLRLLNFSAIFSSAPSTSIHGCAMVLNLHGDNYAGQCRQFLQYVLMEHFYYGVIGQVVRRKNIIDGSPLCQTPNFG